MNLIGLFRQAGPRLLWSGQLTSAVGDRLYAAALIWLTLRLTGSPGAVSLVTLAGTLPFLAASVISGALADRRDGLRLARAANIAQVLVVSVIPIAYLAGHLGLAVLVAAASGLGALEAFCLPVLQASLPRLVERRWLTPMVSLLDTTDRLARIIGPGAIGVLTAFLPEIHLFTVDAASFAVSAWCLGRVARRARPGPVPAVGQAARARPPRRTAGWQVLWRHGDLRRAAALRGACNLAWPAFTIGAPFLVADHYHRGAGSYGLALGSFGAGNLIGNALAGRAREPRLLRLCCAAWALSGLGFIAMAAAPGYYLFALACAATGTCTPLANVTVDAYIARSVDLALLTRTYTAQRLVVVAAATAGLPAAAITVSHLGAAAALALAGAFITGAAALAGTRRVSPWTWRRPGSRG